ncbi:conserved hypothetical protein [uncultured Desulfobacterium sp.]|uniref:Phospholipase C/D domain-containing protein n=1 Tax=uncultured Desulfobacterium sp. TaxID=201089 RepID=A0A445N3A2_9BACT|nr:conserved hypothetical protein [uncultured Desulfobacterium sp.]
MFIPIVFIFLIFSFIFQILCPSDVFAWGPGVHTVIALNILSDVSLILPSIAEIITAFPVEYLYGCLAADFFVGKSRMKKAGRAHNWQGGLKLLGEAGDVQEKAYAYGFLSHLAADVVAHNIFVPNMISEYRAIRKRSHLYWEIRADYLVGPEYTKIARGVLAMDHYICDNLLRSITGKRKKAIGARKLIFTQSVKFSDRAYTTRHVLFPFKRIDHRGFDEYGAVMIGLTLRVVNGFLRYPESSACLLHDPIGLRNLYLAKQSTSLIRLFRTKRPSKSFPVDQRLLKL